jgi:serpin B
MNQPGSTRIAAPVGYTPLALNMIDFALDLYEQLSSIEGNLFFSPYSILTALAMTYAGARGATADQMRRALYFSLKPEQLHQAFAQLQECMAQIEKKGGVQLKIANALWPHLTYPFLLEYLALVEHYYGVGITGVNYNDPEAARDTINAWVEGKTEQKIKQLIPEGILNELTRLVLTNAIYFKGDWARQFDPLITEPAPFWVASGVSVTASMMYQEGQFHYCEAPGVQILELPYIGGGLSMIVLLPDEVDGLAHLEQNLTAENLVRWTWMVSNGDREVELTLPRFKLSYACQLDKMLQSMGMVDAFSDDEADFSGMDGTDYLYISAVLHKAFVAINEEGTEAAAATAVVVKMRGLPEAPAVFRADHPFIFLIQEKSSGSILFLGRVVRPAESV